MQCSSLLTCDTNPIELNKVNELIFNFLRMICVALSQAHLVIIRTRTHSQVYNIWFLDKAKVTQLRSWADLWAMKKMMMLRLPSSFFLLLTRCPRCNYLSSSCRWWWWRFVLVGRCPQISTFPASERTESERVWYGGFWPPLVCTCWHLGDENDEEFMTVIQRGGFIRIIIMISES